MREVRKVLAVIGAKELTELTRHALGHPELDVEVVSAEKHILAALESGEFSLAIAGPGVGRRPPLVVADALRLRVPGLRVVVLLGSETDEQDLREHQARALQGVSYLDLSELISDQARGDRIRAAVLQSLELSDDEASGASWVDRWQKAAEAAEAPAAELEQTEAEEIEPVGEIGEIEATQPPRVPLPMSEEDLEFAKRIVQQTRTVNFRAPVLKSTAADGLDHTVQRLRDQVRQLERQLARLAFVYQSRSRLFDSAEQSVAEAEARRETTSRHWQAAREREAHKEAGWHKERAEHHAQQQAFAERLNGLETVVADLAGQTGGLWAASKESSQTLIDGLNRVQDTLHSLHATLQEPWKIGRRLPATLAPRAASVEGVRENEEPILLTDVVEPERVAQPPRIAGMGPWRYLQWVLGAALFVPLILVLLRGDWEQPYSPEPGTSEPALAEITPPPMNATDPAATPAERIAIAADAGEWEEIVTIAAALGPAAELGADETWWLAEAHRRLGRRRQAEQAYWRFVEAFTDDRRSGQAWLRLGDLLTRQERVDEASDIYEMLATEGEDAVRRKALVLLQRLRSKVPPGDADSNEEEPVQ